MYEEMFVTDTRFYDNSSLVIQCSRILLTTGCKNSVCELTLKDSTDAKLGRINLNDVDSIIINGIKFVKER